MVKAAWNVFGESYRYRQRYNEYKEIRKSEEARGGTRDVAQMEGQIVFDVDGKLCETKRNGGYV